MSKRAALVATVEEREELSRLVDGRMTLRAGAEMFAAGYWPNPRSVGAFWVSPDGLSARFSIADGSATYVVRFASIHVSGYANCEGGVIIERVVG